MFNVAQSVRKIQVAFRQFSVTKYERCGLITQEWIRIEDSHLVKFYKFYAELVCAEEQQKVALQNFSYVKNRNRAGAVDIFSTMQKEMGLDSHKNVAGSHSLAETTVDWKQFRIPELERITMVERYYGVQLRRHSR